MTKELKFIHISKTGGTTIEDIGKEHGIQWGRWHKEYGFWHVFFSKKPKELKEKYDWFMVVRNPYSRILSEFHCNWVGNRNPNCTKAQFNEHIRRGIKNRYGGHWHYVEQHPYFEKGYKIHILKFENLEKEFNELMKKYNLNIKLNLHANSAKKKRFTVSDLDEESIKLIKEIYKKDFIMFGYSLDPKDASY